MSFWRCIIDCLFSFDIFLVLGMMNIFSCILDFWILGGETLDPTWPPLFQQLGYLGVAQDLSEDFSH